MLAVQIYIKIKKRFAISTTEKWFQNFVIRDEHIRLLVICHMTGFRRWFRLNSKRNVVKLEALLRSGDHDQWPRLALNNEETLVYFARSRLPSDGTSAVPPAPLYGKRLESRINEYLFGL